MRRSVLFSAIAAVAIAAMSPPLAVKKPQALTSMVNQAGSVHSLIKLTDEHCYAFNQVHASAAWMQLSKLKRKRHFGMSKKLEQNLEPLVERTIHLAASKQLSGRAIANIAYGSVKSGMRSSPSSEVFFDALEESASARRLSECTPQALANLVWAFATARKRAPGLFSALAAAAAPKLDDFESQHLSMTAWSYATSDYAAPALFDGIATASLPRLDEFEPRHLSVTAWSFATLGRRSPQLFDGIARESVRRLDEFNPQDFCNLAWAFATVGHSAPLLFDHMAEEAAPQLDDFTPQGLANFAYAFNGAPSMQYALRDRMLKDIAKASIPRLDDFSSRNLVNLVLPLTSHGLRDPQFFDALAKTVKPRLNDFKDFPQGLSHLAWAFAEAGNTDAALFDQMAATIEPRVEELTPHAVSRTAWAFVAQPSPAAARLFDAIAAVVAARVREFSAQELGQLGMAFARASFATTRYTWTRQDAEALDSSSAADAELLQAKPMPGDYGYIR